MDVFKTNFAAVLPEFNEQLRECDFLAIDCEFTGLFTTISNDYLATYEQYYSKLRTNINKFQLIQLGISLFKQESESKFACHSFNFNLFPNKCSLLPRDECERYFLCQSSSLKFLIENNFDFNKLIKDGISYVNLPQMKFIKDRLSDKKSNPITVETEESKKFLNDIAAKIKEFMASSENELVLPPYNSFQRKLIYDWANGSEFSALIDLSVPDKRESKMVVKKCSAEERSAKLAASLLENIGFTHIIELLINHPKPIVGHNIYLDLLYIYNAFISPLPAQYSEFKMSFHALFPVVFDTKYISADDCFRAFIMNTALDKVFETVTKHPFIPTDIELKNGDFSVQAFHQAGYDSYVTGVCFLNLLRYRYAQEFTPVPHMFANDILAVYRNRISIYRVYDIKYFNLESEDILSDRSNVFHVTFPRAWRRNDLNLVFEEFGGLSNVVFIDDESAFCILRDASNAGKVVDRFILNAKPSFPFKVKPYADHLKSQDCVKMDCVETPIRQKQVKQRLRAEATPASVPKKIRKEFFDPSQTSPATNNGQELTGNQLFKDENNWDT